MPLTAGQGPYAREHWRHWINREVEELPEGWKDDMIRRQLEECSRQLIRLTNATTNTPERKVDDKQRALDARTLATLRREVKELLSMENDCAVRRNTRAAQNSEDVVAILERRLRQLLERERQAQISFRPQQTRSDGNS